MLLVFLAICVIMKYKTIYMPHEVSTLVTSAKQMSDWDTTLNKHAKEGWTVKNCGTISASNNVIFWALLKKKDDKEFDI